MLDLTKIQSKRRKWQPSNPAPNSETSGATITISKCLSLTNLEPVVAKFISDGLSKYDVSKLSPGLIEQLETNITDEDNHEIALTQCKAAMKDYDSRYEAEVPDICQRWLDLPDCPIVSAAVLENSVFFCILPIYSIAGGISLRQTSQSISGDERIHVATHREASMLLGARPSKQLNRLRLDTVEWLFNNVSELGKAWTLDRMINNSNSLLAKGISDMIETQIASVSAPFEQNNNVIEGYA